MYYPETVSEKDINTPKSHQRIISKLTASLGHLFYHEHEIALEPLPETQIDAMQALFLILCSMIMKHIVHQLSSKFATPMV